MRILWEESAWSDYLYWREYDKKTLKRINALIKDAQRSPFDGIGKPEALKGISKKCMNEVSFMHLSLYTNLISKYLGYIVLWFCHC